ncbi:glycosyltransferase family 39 protein [Arundinibacter roseus]|uniref:Phospholipid carrier-dependent glycosyltransferase n=1 Tax=Arundinibacter roseus TaxID=2070510 RepID=A0A4R4KDH1_9BACT|nr:glycosyltransferase family 39 protein [Arundinibacter roseus]TDB65888.1 phospholipid carrier-dependent glycosyltransferase [Arundinibacter roseus]
MHPPLYYLLAAPFFLMDEFSSQKVTQLFSLILSIGNLYVLYLLCIKLFKNNALRNVSFLLAVFLHSLVTFSLYVSNDTLAFFLGSLLFLYLHQYIRKPSQSKEILLAILLGLGLLTKGTFLAFAPPLVAVVGLSLWKKELTFGRIFFRVFVFCLLFCSVGSYKFFENYLAEGRFIVHNIEFFQYMPAGSYIGIKSFLLFDFKRLLLNPTFFEGDFYLEHLYSILFYATFWYKYMEPFNGFELGSQTSFKYMGSLIYMAGLVPTLLILLGFARKTISSFSFLFTFKNLNSALFAKRLEEAAWISMLVLSLILVLMAGLKYDVWVCFQSRLLLQAFFPILWLLYVGLETIQKKSGFLLATGVGSILLVSLLYLIYYLTEGIFVLY